MSSGQDTIPPPEDSRYLCASGNDATYPAPAEDPFKDNDDPLLPLALSGFPAHRRTLPDSLPRGEYSPHGSDEGSLLAPQALDLPGSPIRTEHPYHQQPFPNGSSLEPQADLPGSPTRAGPTVVALPPTLHRPSSQDSEACYPHVQEIQDAVNVELADAWVAEAEDSLPFQAHLKAIIARECPPGLDERVQTWLDGYAGYESGQWDGIPARRKNLFTNRSSS
ncbi:hypothetical protein B0H17DRAFT_450012 [Mycena rosella]|uniref:Uncharacterized protein n=1 Tax=Mycena rosella TaxID=1033263 RepID=A0AAD7FVH8_MYCRO|nr:hypothetical protein B0H17DRAFT_450012 [Mycena rosella]